VSQSDRLFEGRVKILPDQRPYRLRFPIVGIVVAGAQRIGANMIRRLTSCPNPPGGSWYRGPADLWCPSNADRTSPRRSGPDSSSLPPCNDIIHRHRRIGSRQLNLFDLPPRLFNSSIAARTACSTSGSRPSAKIPPGFRPSVSSDLFSSAPSCSQAPAHRPRSSPSDRAGDDTQKEGSIRHIFRDGPIWSSDDAKAISP